MENTYEVEACEIINAEARKISEAFISSCVKAGYEEEFRQSISTPEGKDAYERMILDMAMLNKIETTSKLAYKIAQDL